MVDGAVPDRPPLFVCEHLLVGYRGPILPPIDLTIGRGEFWAVIGRNGSGKSTWFKTMLGLLPAVGGTIRTPSGPPRLTYVPQRHGYDAVWPLSAFDVVALGCERGGSFLRRAPAARMARDALEEVGGSDLADRTFRSLSEGQKQRVLLARLLATRAEVAFLDEPTAAMDPVAEREALTLVDRIRRSQGTTVVVVSHELDVVTQFAERVIFFDRLTQQFTAGTPSEVLGHPGFRARYGVLGVGLA